MNEAWDRPGCDPLVRELVDGLLAANPALGLRRVVERVSRTLRRPPDESLLWDVAVAVRDVRQAAKRGRNRRVGAVAAALAALLTVAAAAGLAIAWLNRDDWPTADGSARVQAVMVVSCLVILVLASLGLVLVGLRSAITGADLPDWPLRAIGFSTRSVTPPSFESPEDFSSIEARRRRAGDRRHADS